LFSLFSVQSRHQYQIVIHILPHCSSTSRTPLTKKDYCANNLVCSISNTKL
ncbi:unnamed protein product, partial [Brassica rapa subsp. narinosa]